MALQYIGARYVIKIYENKTNPSTAEWDSNTFYEPLTMVTYEYNSYLSKKDVPPTVGNPAANPTYWAQTGYYSGQIRELQNHVTTLETKLNNEIATRTSDVSRLTAKDTALANSINNEELARINAVNALNNAIESVSQNLSVEISQRQTAVSDVHNEVVAEATARAAGDSNLQTQIDNIVAPSGEAPSAAEVTNARIGVSGYTFDSLGAAIRTQVTDIIKGVGGSGITKIGSFVTGYAIAIPASGTTTTLTPVEFSNGGYSIIEIDSEYEKVIFSGAGSPGNARAYGFLDENLKVLDRADQNHNASYEILTPPVGTKYYVVNSYFDEPYSPFACAFMDASKAIDLAYDKLGLKGHRYNPTVVNGSWEQTGKYTSYTKAWVCVDKRLYLTSDSYILNPNGMRIELINWDSDSDKAGSSISTSTATRINISDAGWYTISARYNDYRDASASDMPQSNLYLYYDDAHAPKPTMECKFISGGKDNYYAVGDCTVFTTPTGKKLIVDFAAGTAVNFIKAKFCEYGALKPDYCVVSHYHDDHIGNLVVGLEQGWLDLNGATLFLPDPTAMNYVLAHDLLEPISLGLYNRLQAALANVDCTIVYPSVDLQPVMLDDYTSLEFFNCVQSYLNGETTDYNNYSLCCYVKMGNTRICMTGDISRLAEEHLAGTLYKTNILKAMHHGWDGAESALDSKFMSNVFPEAIISEDGQVHDERIDTDGAAQQSWAERYCIPNYRVNTNGVISVNVTEENYNFASPVTSYVRNTKNWKYTDNSEYNS